MPTEQAAAASAQSPFFQYIPFVLIFFIFYFLVFKPEKKKKKEREDMKSNLKKNDRVVTSGGIHGTVVSLKEKSVMVRVDDNVKLELDKESISTVIK